MHMDIHVDLAGGAAAVAGRVLPQIQNGSEGVAL